MKRPMFSMNPMGMSLMLLLLLLTSKASQAKEAYATFTEADSTLTFFMDELRSTRPGVSYSLNVGNSVPDWYENHRNISRVVFDPSFDTARPTSTHSWFDGMYDLTSITGIHFLNTESVTDMANMFFACNSLTSLDLNNFNTSNVRDMSNMFYECISITVLDLSGFNTSSVTNMHGMFNYCEDSLSTLDLSSFSTENVEDMIMMFQGCNRLETIYVGKGWSTNSVTHSYNMFYGCVNLVGGQGTVYDAGHVDATRAHIDGGSSNPGYFTPSAAAYAVISPDHKTLSFYCDTLWYFRPGSSYLLNTEYGTAEWAAVALWQGYEISQVVFDPSFAAARPTSTNRWFFNMDKLASIAGIEYLNTSSVTDMENMFYGCNSLTSLDVSGFNTSNVTNMMGMFVKCKSLTSLDVSGFNTENVTDMACMFEFCQSLTSIDVSHFNTPNVTNMVEMFADCLGLTSLDLSSFNTKNVTDMALMFYDCNNLETIYAGYGWSTAAVTSSEHMFSKCARLMGGKGTTYDANHVDATYAHIDGGPSNPGYFTEKTTLLGDVNGDGEVNIADVNSIISIILGDFETYGGRADVNGDGEVNIADVNAVIDCILTGSGSSQN